MQTDCVTYIVWIASRLLGQFAQREINAMGCTAVLIFGPWSTKMARCFIERSGVISRARWLAIVALHCNHQLASKGSVLPLKLRRDKLTCTLWRGGGGGGGGGSYKKTLLEKEEDLQYTQINDLCLIFVLDSITDWPLDWSRENWRDTSRALDWLVSYWFCQLRGT